MFFNNFGSILDLLGTSGRINAADFCVTYKVLSIAACEHAVRITFFSFFFLASSFPSIYHTRMVDVRISSFDFWDPRKKSA